MHYKELFRESIRKAAHRDTLGDSPFFAFIFRKVSFPLTPLFIMLRISANNTTYIRFIGSIFAAVIITNGSQTALAIGIVMFFLLRISDYVDGNIARLMNTQSFYGKFVDGLLDIISACFLRLALSYVALAQFQDHPLMWAGVISATIAPFHHFIFDRYSAFARWINKEKNLDIKPYIRRTIFLRFINLMYDIEYLSLIICVFFFSLGAWIYFLMDIFVAAIYIYSHLRASYKFMRVDNSEDRYKGYL